MSAKYPETPLPVGLPPPALDAGLEPLLAEPFASAWAAAAPPAPAALKGRLLARLQASQSAEAAMTTVRWRRAAAQAAAPGVVVRTLYVAPAGTAQRPGEPLRVRLVDLAPGSRLDPAALGPADELRPRHREWLLVAGSASADGEALAAQDYLVTPAGHPTPAWASAEGARLFVRESALEARPGDRPHAVRDAEAGWPEFAPGIRRRVLWQRDGQAALLYCAGPGASVPVHRHGHDEECLTLRGELFLDDVLMQPGDWQLAPAGSGHRVTETDTGVVLYAHGDLDLRFEG